MVGDWNWGGRMKSINYKKIERIEWRMNQKSKKE